MPETTATRKHAQVVAKRMKLVPWHENRALVMPVVYMELGLGAYVDSKKRKRPARPTAAPPAKECCVCLEETILGVLGCGHQLCSTCRNRVRKCPSCRKEIKTFIPRVF